MCKKSTIISLVALVLITGFIVSCTPKNVEIKVSESIPEGFQLRSWGTFYFPVPEDVKTYDIGENRCSWLDSINGVAVIAQVFDKHPMSNMYAGLCVSNHVQLIERSYDESLFSEDQLLVLGEFSKSFLDFKYYGYFEGLCVSVDYGTGSNLGGKIRISSAYVEKQDGELLVLSYNFKNSRSVEFVNSLIGAVRYETALGKGNAREESGKVPGLNNQH